MLLTNQSFLMIFNLSEVKLIIKGNGQKDILSASDSVKNIPNRIYIGGDLKVPSSKRYDFGDEPYYNVVMEWDDQIKYEQKTHRLRLFHKIMD